jgi:hypothetical protein
MQTFDLRPSASHSPSTRNDEFNSPFANPPQPEENFGEVMNRTLAGNPREGNGEDYNLRNESAGAQENPGSTLASQLKQADKFKKSLQRDPSQDNDAASATAMANPNCQQPSQVAEAQSKSEDDGTSEDGSDSDAEKGKSPAGKSSDAAKSTTNPLLVLAGPLGVPSPSLTAIPAEGKAGKDAKGNSKSVSTVPGQPDAPEGKAHSDAKNIQAKDTTEAGEKVLTASDAAAKETEQSKPHSEKTTPVTTLPASAPDPAGTSAAKHYLTMNKTDKMQKIAEPAEQDLPGNAAIGSEELPTAEKIAAQALPHGSEKLDSTITVDSSVAARISPDPTAAAATTTAAVTPVANVDSRLRVLERTHDIVALHAMRLDQSGSDSLHVVVKPGGGIQLSLELRQSEGIIEVRAALHKGDFAHLSQHWPDLQQRLEARGVRVSDLASSENPADAGHQEFQQPKQQPSPDQDPLHAGAFAEFALAGSLREAPATRAARATAYRGWETWA